jgi:hypothetical protein
MRGVVESASMTATRAARLAEFLFSAIFLLHDAISLRDGEEVQESAGNTLLNLRF